MGEIKIERERERKEESERESESAKPRSHLSNEFNIFGNSVSDVAVS